MPRAMTHNTKKIDSELPFSASTAFGGAVLVVVGEVVFGVSVVRFRISTGLLKVTFMIADGVTFFSRLTLAFTSGTFTDASL